MKKSTARHPTMRWDATAPALELIDQRVLPRIVRNIRCTSAASTAKAIKTMVVRGAPAIGCAAAFGIALEAARVQTQSEKLRTINLAKGFAVLAASRPTAVNLFWALARMQRAVDAHCTIAAHDGTALARKLERLALHIQAEDVRVNRAMGAHGATLIKPGSQVLTHCNAGALATADYGTALGVIRAAGKKITNVWVDETRPFLQGARLTAWELMQDRIPVTLITDNMAAYFMQLGQIDAVVVGTDRVAANGDVCNKIGTYSIALAARAHGIPFYVACPLSTIDLHTKTGRAIPIEERGAAEVTGHAGVTWAPAGVRTANPAFDVTPARLVTGLITERGVLLQPTRAKLALLMRSAPQADVT